jgi:hypothetical protein
MSSISGGSESAEPRNERPPSRRSASNAGAARASTERALSAPSAETRLAGGGALATIGGALMTVGATMHAGEQSSLWLNACWDIGCVLMVVGAAVVIAILCKEGGLPRSRRRRSQDFIRAARAITDERLDALLPESPPETRPSISPVLLKVVDEEWKILGGRLWVLAVAVTFINTVDKCITLTRFTFENCDRRDRLGDHVDEKVDRDADAEFKRMTERRAPELFSPDLVLTPLTPVTKWVIAATLPLPEGGRPECLLRFEDTLGDSYDVHLDRRPVQRFHAQ